MSEIRILTLWQPWASFVALGLKQYETRSWGTAYRGKLVIHAAMRPMSDKDGLLTNLALAIYNSRSEKSPEQLYREIASFPLGCIVAIAELADCCVMHPFQSRVTNYVRTPDTGHIFIDQQSELEKALGDWQPGRYAWKLENIVSLPQPIYCKGGQGLRRVTNATVLQKLQEVIEL